VTGGPSLGELLAEVRRRFADAGLDDPATEARILVAGLAGLSAAALVSQAATTLDPERVEAVRAAIGRRLAHEPVHRILGEREFYGLSLRLSPATLEPRPDTEILVDAVLPHAKTLARAHGDIHILDLGTGTGAICLALLHECPKATGIGSDISAEALRTAAENAARNGLGERFQTIRSDWFDGIQGGFHVIVSNPPYIASSVIATLAPEVTNFDPPAALDGGADGLDAYRVIARDAGRFLHRDGVLGLEIGYDQRVAVTTIFEGAGFFLVESVQDYGRNDRALLFRLKD
jgi:release factor glutamine methyltransferase